MKKTIWITLALVVLGFIGYRAYMAVKDKEAARNEVVAERILPVESGTPRIGTVTEQITQTGNIMAQSEVTLYSKVAGKLVKNHIEMNDNVAPGQVIAMVDRDEVGFEFKQFEVKSNTIGTVAKVFLTPGANVNPNSPLFHVVSIDRVKAVVSVREDKIRFVQKGQTAQVSVDAYPNEVFEGKVTNISPVANPQTRSIDVEITVQNPRHALKPGMFARAELILDHRKAMLIPIAALTERSGRTVVFVVSDSTVRKRSITTGVSLGDSVEVKSGLTMGEAIVVNGTQRLNDGDRIRIAGK